MTGFRTEFTSSVWNSCRWVAHVPRRETSLAARSDEKRLFSQARDTLGPLVKANNMFWVNVFTLTVQAYKLGKQGTTAFIRVVKWREKDNQYTAWKKCLFREHTVWRIFIWISNCTWQARYGHFLIMHCFNQIVTFFSGWVKSLKINRSSTHTYPADHCALCNKVCVYQSRSRIALASISFLNL